MKGEKSMKTRKKPYMNEELFEVIVDILKKKNLLPDILDYHLAERHDSKEIRSYEWDTIGIINFGGSEGIYLDVYAQGEIGNNESKVRLGTFKTLNRSREDFYIMAKLQTDFVYETRDFVNDHIDDFEWTGYNVRFYKGDKRTIGYTTGSKEGINRLLKRHIESDFDYVVITDNATCKERTIEKEKIALD